MNDFVKEVVGWNVSSLLGPKILCRLLSGTIVADCVVDNTFLLTYPTFGIDNYFQTYNVVHEDKTYSDIYKALADIPLENFTTTTEFTIIIIKTGPPILQRSKACHNEDNYFPNTMSIVFKKAYDIIKIKCNLGYYLFPRSKIPPNIMEQCLIKDDTIEILEKLDRDIIFSNEEIFELKLDR